ncbi:MAG: Hpt domain-containing protein [Oscillospiraceae bacterium]
MVDMDRMVELGLNLDQASKRFLGNRDFHMKCIKIYFDTNDIALLEQLCADKNWSKAMECAHTLKGSSGNMAFETLFRIYSEMTDLFRAGENEAAVALLPSAVELEKGLREAAGYTKGNI